MTPKQKLKSIEKKLDRIRDYKKDFDFDEAERNFFMIQKYYNLKREHFLLKFELEHCQTCGKKL